MRKRKLNKDRRAEAQKTANELVKNDLLQELTRKIEGVRNSTNSPFILLGLFYVQEKIKRMRLPTAYDKFGNERKR